MEKEELFQRIKSEYEKRIEYTSDALKEKYDEDFEIKRIGAMEPGGEGMNYTAYCTPTADESLYFKAEIFDDKTLIDGYEECVMGRDVTGIIKSKISELAPDNAVFVSVKKGAEGYRNGMELSEFVDGEMRFNAVIVMCADKMTTMDPAAVWAVLEEIPKSLPYATGVLSLLYAEADELEEFKEYIKDKTLITQTMLEICGARFGTTFGNGKLAKSSDDLFEALY